MEIVLILIGVILFFYFQPMTVLRGLGFGLFIQSSLMLFLDYFAESRGKIYFDFLQTLK